MKKLLIVFAILISAAAGFGQVLQPVNGYGFQYKRFKIDSVATMPRDTLANALGGSLAWINDVWYSYNGTFWDTLGGGSADNWGDQVAAADLYTIIGTGLPGQPLQVDSSVVATRYYTQQNFLASANNLSELSNPALARSNLGFPGGIVATENSLTGDGISSPIQLDNDQDAPGANMVYGTDASGVKGWKVDPAGSAGWVTSVSGTTNRITVTGTSASVIDIASTYVGQTSITTIGTVTNGTWNATPIANAYLANSTIGLATPGFSGTAPNFTAVNVALGNSIVLNIPMASAAGVTAGLISKTDYDAFMAVATSGGYPDIASNRLIGRTLPGFGPASAITGTDATTVLSVFTSTDQGVVPASGGGTVNFLRADGIWADPAVGGGGLSDGDRGDITVSSGGILWTINNLAVTNGKINDVAFSKVTGTISAAQIAGTATEGYVLTIVGGTPTLAAPSGTTLSDGDYGDIVLSSSASVWTIDANAVTTSKINNLAVTNAKINDVAWSKVTGTPTTRAGYGITDALSNSLLDGFLYIGNGSNVATGVAMSGDVGIINTGFTTISAGAVSFAKFQDITQGRLLGRYTASDGPMQEITIGAGLLLNSGTGELTASGGGGYTTEQVQDDVGAMIDATLTYVDATPLLGINLANANTWTADQSVPDESYGVGWDGSMEVPTKNALYDKIETIVSGGGVTINNNANDRIITGSGTANTLEAESNFTWDGTIHGITATGANTRYFDPGISQPFTFGGAFPATFVGRGGEWSTLFGGLLFQGFSSNDNGGLLFQGHIGSTTPTVAPIHFQSFKSDGSDSRVALAAGEKTFSFFNGTTEIWAVDGDGSLTIYNSTGTDRNIKIQNGSATDAVGTLSIYSTATDGAQILRLLPRGTGYSTGSINAGIDLFNSDYLTDQTNYEFYTMRTNAATGLVTNSLKGGTGTARGYDWQIASASVLNISTAGLVTVNALKIDHATAADGYVWTATDADGNGQWEAVPAGGVTTMAAIGATPNGNGATISGSTLTLQPASGSFGGVVNTAAQDFGGIKTFQDAVVVGFAGTASAGLTSHGTTYSGVFNYAAGGVGLKINSTATASGAVYGIVYSKDGVYNGAVNDAIWMSRFQMRNASGTTKEMGDIYINTLDATNSVEDAEYMFRLITAGGMQESLRITGSDLQFKNSGNEWLSAVNVTINDETTSYTLLLTDAGKLVRMNSGSANNLTVPLNSSVAFPIGTQITISQLGAGQTTIVATGGVTINSAGGALKLRVQYSTATLIKTATDTWLLMGDITT